MKDIFNHFSVLVAKIVGSPASFVFAVFLLGLWLVAGPIYNYSESWQLVVNTSTTIITFLMVFILQNSQNRDTKTIHLKLDELIKAQKGARVGLINMDEYSDEELKTLENEFHKLHTRGYKKVAKNLQDQIKKDKKTAK